MNAEPRRLTLSEMLEIEHQRGGLLGLPVIHGWVQATLRELPVCDCGTRMRLLDERPCRYLCDACGRSTTDGGPIVKQVAQKNIVYNELWIFLMLGWASGTWFQANNSIIISNDDQPVHAHRAVWYATYADAYAVGAAATIDYTNKIWTMTATFSAPTAPGRYVRLIGVRTYHDAGVNYATYGRCIGTMASGTKLTSELYQTSTQTLEIVYKYVFSQA